MYGKQSTCLYSYVLTNTIMYKTQQINYAKARGKAWLFEATYFDVPAGLEASVPLEAVYGLMTDGFLYGLGGLSLSFTLWSSTFLCRGSLLMHTSPESGHPHMHTFVHKCQRSREILFSS